MIVVGGHHHGVERLVVQRPAEISFHLRHLIRLSRGELLRPRGRDPPVHVAGVGDPAVAAVEESVAEMSPTSAEADDGQRNFIVRRRCPNGSWVA